MMSFATGRFCQDLSAPKVSIKLLTLLLRTCVLPIRAERVRKCAGKLLLECLVFIQVRQQLFCILTPVDTAMLLPRAADPSDAAEIQPLVSKLLQHTVQGL